MGKSKPPPNKRRYTADKRPVKVTIITPPDDKVPPGYSGHTAGKFDEAGYSAGQGMFGFKQTSR